MADVKQAWGDVGRSLEALGLKLKLHLEEGVDEGDRETLTKALRKLGAVVDQGASSLSRAVHDPAVKADVDALAGAVRDAVAATIEDAGSTIRRNGS